MTNPSGDRTEKVKPDASQAMYGTQIEGNVHAEGDFIGRDKVINIAETSTYDVSGLANPYLGLQSYTYEQRLLYAGRADALQSAMDKLTMAQQESTILFITGASGSGKSSFVLACLIPELERWYAPAFKLVRHVALRPGNAPIASLQHALNRLEPGISSIADLDKIDQVTLIVVDQFEELFTQAGAEERNAFLSILEGLEPFERSHTHVIATVRSDFLSELFNHKSLWAAAKAGVDLRNMSKDELRSVIERPLQRLFPNGEKRFELALVNRLVDDAADDATLLPLLQVTLWEIWKSGSLRLSVYGSLTDAIRKHADTVMDFSDFARASPIERRPVADRGVALNMMLDLIKVTLDDESKRDVRRRQLKTELVQGSLLKSRLVENLVQGRLLSITTEPSNGQAMEWVDIIHESLIQNWSRLIRAIQESRIRLQMRERFSQHFQEWSAKGEDKQYLVTGVRLAEARELNLSHDIVLKNERARRFLDWSTVQEDEKQRHALQIERSSRRRLQLIVGILAVLLLASAAAIGRPFVLSLLARGEVARVPGNTLQLSYFEAGTDSEQKGPFITVDSYVMEKYEVANWQYRLCVEVSKCAPPVDATAYDDPDKNEHPVVGITYYQAEAYCTWIGRRLPTDAEWLNAARGINNFPWPWGKSPLIANKANLVNIVGDTAPIRSFPDGQSIEGIFNLVGNVWEYTATPSLNSDGNAVVLRGGGWQDNLTTIIDSTSIVRIQMTDQIGFRCVSSLVDPFQISK